MKLTLSGLKQFLSTNANIQEIADTLTMIGLESESIDNQSVDFKHFEVGKIIETKIHPNANKLQVCIVDTTLGNLQIVCGASNARSGIKVVIAHLGALIPASHLKIKKSIIRGIESMGMLCSEDELGIIGNTKGIIELEDNAMVGDNITKYLNLDISNDPVLHINVTPNRGDALSVYGIARDLAATSIGSLKKINMPQVVEHFVSSVKVINNDIKSCPLFAVREINGLINKQSPNWLKNYLNNVGINSISALVDIINYISHTFGQPMHLYDADKITGGITVERLSENLDFTAINNTQYSLTPGTLIIRDEKELHCIAGVIGGINSAVSKSTTKVILEAAAFNREYMLQAGSKFPIDSDSRYRFERNVNRAFTLEALDIATDLIISICGGNASTVTTTGNANLSVKMIDFPIDFLTSKTNLCLDAEEITNILNKLGFECKINNNLIQIAVPSWRYHDISIKEDIVEEIIRIYGYNNLPTTPLTPRDIFSIIPREQKRISDIKRIIASIGYTEVITWSFMDSKKIQLFTKLDDELILQNPISANLDYMRPSILFNLLKLVSNNVNRSFYDLSFFEVGPIFENTIDIINHASAIRIGNNFSKNIHGDSRIFDVFDMKSDIATVLESIGLHINQCTVQNTVPKYYHPTKSASLYLGQKIIGYFGQVHPLILKEYNINIDVMAFELNVTSLPFIRNNWKTRPAYKESNYQKIIRDYSFIVDVLQPVGIILDFIKNLNTDLIRDVEIFDIYSGNNIEDGKKSIALSVVIQDNYKTLLESDINSISTLIIKGIVNTFNAVLRE